MRKNLALLFLVFSWISCNHEPQNPVKITAKTNQVDSLIHQDSTVIGVYSPYKKKMTEEINKVLSYASQNLTKNDGELQSTLGNLMADLMYEKTGKLFEKETGKKVDFAMSNHGGIRASIWKGEVKVMHAFNLMPFDNTLVVVEMTKEKIEELFTYFVEKHRAHPLSKQVQLTISKGDNFEVLIHGKPLEDRTYFVATSNYLQKGGDNMNFFANPVSLYDSNFLIRDAITEYFTAKDTLTAPLDNRVQLLNN